YRVHVGHRPQGHRDEVGWAASRRMAGGRPGEGDDVQADRRELDQEVPRRALEEPLSGSTMTGAEVRDAGSFVIVMYLIRSCTGARARGELPGQHRTEIHEPAREPGRSHVALRVEGRPPLSTEVPDPRLSRDGVREERPVAHRAG